MKKRTNTFYYLSSLCSAILLVLFGFSGVHAQNPVPITCGGGPTGATNSHIQFLTLEGENGTEIDYEWPTDPPNALPNNGPLGIEDETSQVVELELGETYTIEFNLWSRGLSQFTSNGAVWIDFNQDGELSPDELIHEGNTPFVTQGGWDGNNPTDGVTSSSTFTVPSDAIPGEVTMRAMQQQTGITPLNPCASYFSGAMIEFTVEILPFDGCDLVSCPDPVIELSNDLGECGAFVDIDLPTLDGPNCGQVEFSNSYNDDADPSDFYPVGTTEVTIVAQGVGTCDVSITVTDDEPPTLSCPADIDVALAPGECNQIVTYDIQADDNCPFEETGSLWGYEGLTNLLLNARGSTFDLTNESPNPIVVDGFSIPVRAIGLGTREYSVYATTTVNTNVGNQLNPGVWELIGTATVTSTTASVDGDPSTYHMVPIGGLEIAPGETRGVYFFADGPASGAPYISLGATTVTQTDGDLTMTLNGYGISNTVGAPFTGTHFGPVRGFPGEVFYTIGAGGDLVQTDGLPSGDEFDVGTTLNCFETEDNAGNIGTCCFSVNVSSFPNATTTLACNNHVNVSVDENCSVDLNADMFLEGGPYKCYDEYVLEFTDDNGVVVDLEDLFLPDYINQQFVFSVTDPETGNKCWGTVLFEDKLAPIIECRNISVLCGDDIPEEPAPAFDNEPFSMAFTGLNDEFGNVAFGPAPETIEYEFDFSNLDDDFTVADVKLRVDMDMLRPHNNTIRLESPDGSIRTIYNATTFNAGTFPFDVTFDDEGEVVTAYAQLNQLSDGAPMQPIDGTIAAGAGPVFFEFAGESAQGIWTVTFQTTFASAFTAAGGEVREVELIVEVDADAVEPFDNCGGFDIEFADDVQEFNLCDEVPTVINRNWTVTDQSGNTASCVQVIEILRTGLDELTLPGTASLSCTQNFAVDDQGNPHPSVTGEPGGQCENVLSTYTDILINDCPGETKILRDWSLVDWCTGETRVFTQVIKIENNTTPDIECLPSVDVSTEFNACEGTWDATLESLFATGAIDALPEDVCSDDVGYTVSSSAGTVENINDNWIITGLPVGTHQVTYTANDGCGNTAECVTNVNVVDDVAPVAICDLDTRVSLGGGTQGFARVFVDAFDDGSWDNCGVESILVRRSRDDNNFSKNSQCDNSRTDWQEFMDFCCADIEARDGEVDIYVQVTDLSGNTNICSVTVFVEDNVPPSITCPSELNVTVNCLFEWGDFDFNDPNSDVSQATLDELFGGIVPIQLGVDRVTRVVDPAAQPANALDEVTIIDGFTIDNCPNGLEIEQEIFTGVIEQCNYLGNGVQVTPTQERIVFGQTTPQQRQGFEMDGDLAIVRGWRVTDAFGNVTLDCVQEIKVINTSPFTGIDNLSGLPPSQWEIEWPGDQTLGICTDGTGLDPDDMGRPDIRGPNLGCADILINYTDQIFTGPQAGSACLKVLRKWEVIDWCQPQTIQQPWSHIQTIKVMNSDAPVVTNCEDVTFEFPEAEGCEAQVDDFVLEVEHACIDEDLLEDALVVTYQIDAFNTGSFDISGTGFDASGVYPYGEHRIVWTVTDPCGNETVCEHLFTVADLKEPTPVCFNGIATVVMPSAASITLGADYFDAGSFDNCGDVDLLIWSDETEMTETDPINYEEEWTWTCDDLEGASEVTFEVRILAVDQFGNSDWCETYVRIQDNMNVCPDTASGTALISGLITNEEGHGVEKVDVDLNSQNGGFGLSFHTGSDGSFTFTGVPMAQQYDLRGTRTDNPLNGVTTYDIALIQRHILGTQYLDNPYKLIAADVNNDGQINVVDIAQLRRLILGTYDEFPNNDSWKVIVDEDLTMGVTVPDHRTVMDLGMVNRDLFDNNFIGVKIGDVNASHNASGVLSSTERSLAEALELRINDEQLRAGEQVVIAVNAANAEGLFGYQGTINFDQNSLEFVGFESGAIELSDANFGFHLLSEGMITTSWSDTEALTEGAELFSLVFEVKSDGQLSEKLDFSSNQTVAEAYNDRGVMGVEMVFEGSAMEVNNFSLYQNTPNPFTAETRIGFVLPEATEATLTIYDVTGKVVHVIEGDYNQGYNEEGVSRDQLGSAGVYYYQLETGDHTATKKMIFMD